MKRLIDDKRVFFLIMEGLALTLSGSLVSNYCLMFAIRMGANSIHIALLSSLPPLVAILVLIPCGIIIEKMKDKRVVTCALIGINSVFYLVIAFVPFIPNQIRLIAYVILIGLMNWPGSLYASTWQTFFSDSFSGESANRVFAMRSKYSSFLAIITVLIAGFILSSLPKNDSDRIIIYQCFFVICFFTALLQIFFLSKLKSEGKKSVENPQKEVMHYKIGDIKEIFINKKFMIFCWCSVVFHFGWQGCWPILFIYNTHYVGVNEFQLGIISVAMGLSSFAAYSLWSRFARRKGNSLVIIFGAFGLALNPFIYMRVWDFYIVVIINVIIGVALAGFNLTLFCSLLEILPEKKKTVYIAFFNTLLSITGFTAPLVSIFIYGHLGIFITFFIFGCLRMLGTGMYAARWFLDNRNNNIAKRRCIG